KQLRGRCRGLREGVREDKCCARKRSPLRDLVTRFSPYTPFNTPAAEETPSIIWFHVRAARSCSVEVVVTVARNRGARRLLEAGDLFPCAEHRDEITCGEM